MRRRASLVRLSVLCFLLAISLPSGAIGAQQGLDRSRDNNVYPAGYETATEANAGRYESVGNGPTRLVFIGGWGFSGDIFREFAGKNATDYTTLLVTLPGFGGTSGWPMPADSVSHATTPWMSRSADAISRIMTQRGVRDAIVIGHFIVGSHVALELAQRHPDQVRGIVLAGAELSRYWPSRADTTGRTPATPAQRAASVDRFMVPQFFRFVTDSTWHANNYLPQTFSVDSWHATRLWREQSLVPLPIMMRYLSDFYATEFAPKLDSIRAPLLILQPAFNERIVSDPRTSYLTMMFQDSWKPAQGRSGVEIQVVPNAAVNVWLDQPDAFAAALKKFVSRTAPK